MGTDPTLQDLTDDSSADDGEPFVIDTTPGSWLHHFGNLGQLSAVRLYVSAALLTYVPLMLSALVGPAHPFHPSLGVKLPFFRDCNVAFMLLVSFPALVVFTLRDQAILAAALLRVQRDGVLTLRRESAELLAAEWSRKFKVINHVAYAIGLLTGIIIVIGNYAAYVPARVGFWIAVNGHLQLCGYGFLACIFALYTLIPIYAIRTFGISMFLRSLVRHAEQLHMLPFHPDRCGGLRPVGRLGLRNQYLLTVFALNIGTLVAMSEIYLQVPRPLYWLIAAAVVAYIILGPLIFMGPLLSFRAGMLRTKTELMSEVAQRLRVELGRLRRHLPSGEITKEDEELIERLRKVGAVIDELPVWPFDAGTLRKFLTAYVVPLAGALIGSAGYATLQKVISFAGKFFQASP